MSSVISEGIFFLQRYLKRKIVNIIQFLTLVEKKKIKQRKNKKMSKITFALELILSPTRRRLPAS